MPRKNSKARPVIIPKFNRHQRLLTDELIKRNNEKLRKATFSK